MICENFLSQKKEIISQYCANNDHLIAQQQVLAPMAPAMCAQVLQTSNSSRAQ